MEKLTRITLPLVTLYLLLFLPNNHLLGGTGQKKALIQEFISTDSIQIILYDFKSADFDLIKQIIIDSCVQRFDCNKLEYAWISVEKGQSDNIYFYKVRSIYHSSYLSLYPKSVQEVAAFCIDETTFFMDNKNFDVLNESENTTLVDTLFIDKESIKYNCLTEEIEGDEYPVIFNFDFEVRKGERVKLINYGFLVESGDTGYYQKPSFRERIKTFFKKIF